MVTSITLDVSQLDEVVLIFVERDPLGLLTQAKYLIVSIACVAIRLKDLGSSGWAHVCGAKVKLAVVIAGHVESVAASVWGLEVALEDLTIGAIFKVVWSLEFQSQVFSVVRSLQTRIVEPVGGVHESATETMLTHIVGIS
jgi:hypothetical protein